MMYRMLKYLVYCIGVCCLGWGVTSSVAASELWLKDIPLNKLQELYQEAGYIGDKDYLAGREYLMIETKAYPPIFLQKFPKEFFAVEDEQTRSWLFIKMLIPLALKLNEDLLAERKIIEDINQITPVANLSEEQIKIIEEKAAKYDVFTRLKGEERYRYLLSELLLRIDVIPPSIILSMAAIDTNYGTSRAFREGNSLYKILNWYSDEGLKPIGDDDAEYRIRIYPDIYASLKDFALRFNSHPNFEFVRHTRSTLRENASSPRIQGRHIAAYSFANSELKNYAGILNYTISYYELAIVDKSVLNNKMVTDDMVKKYSRYAKK